MSLCKFKNACYVMNDKIKHNVYIVYNSLVSKAHKSHIKSILVTQDNVNILPWFSHKIIFKGEFFKPLYYTKLLQHTVLKIVC